MRRLLTSLAAVTIMAAWLPSLTIASAAASTQGREATTMQLSALAASRPAAPQFETAVTTELNFMSCLDVFNSGTANYTNVDIWTCNNTSAQNWNFVPIGPTSLGTAYIIRAGVGTNMCLDDYHGGTNNGNNVDIYHCNETAAQVWVRAGNELISSTSIGPGEANLCLDVHHSQTADGTNVDVFACNGTLAQAWAF